ncbi:MAG TPA: 3-oxoacyl-[acyl-carrier-protein] synthase III C-terminal domain-containing protein [Waterburya sp.]|jgi:3-oxoacyl-[acyl-carrier-protein] synthase III/acyl carrier protein
MNPPAGIRSLALSFPSLIRTNNYWIEKSPNLITRNKPRRARISKSTELTNSNNGLDIWSQEVAPYLPDPFRGSIERRVIAPNESSLTLEYQAAKEALDAAQLAPEDVDLAIVASLFPEHIGPGSAAYLARQLKLRCPAWNLESTCSSAIIALQNACALVRSGDYRNVLVVVSHIGSNSVDEEDTLSWSIGDGAGAFVVDSLQPNQGILGSKIVPTVATCGAYSYELVTDAQGQPRIRTRTGDNASMLAETAVDCVRTCCEGAVAAAGVTFEQIDFFAFNTPTAWYASVCTRALGIDPERTINLYPRYANIGPVFAIANLYHAAQVGKIRENDLVLVYTNGAAATAAAMVMRWGDVALGSVPASPISVTAEQERIHLAIKTEKPSTGATSFLTREQLLVAKPEERRQMLESYLMGCLASSLQLPVNELNSQQSLATLLDSLMAIVLRSRIETDLQVRVPMENFFGESTIAQLAELLLNQLVLANLISLDSVAEANEGEEREILSF